MCGSRERAGGRRKIHLKTPLRSVLLHLPEPATVPSAAPAAPQRTQGICRIESRHTVRRVSNGVRNRLALGPRSRFQKLIHDLDPSAWYKATDGFGPSRTDAQADQALCFPVLCGDTCMRVWSSKHRGLSARRAALPWNLAFWLSFTTATRPARY